MNEHRQIQDNFSSFNQSLKQINTGLSESIKELDTVCTKDGQFTDLYFKPEKESMEEAGPSKQLNVKSTTENEDMLFSDGIEI